MLCVNRIEIKGYKSIKESDLKLNALNVLIGANGAGKSNFISLFELLRQVVENNLELYVPASGGADTFLHFGQKITSEIYIRVCFEKIVYLCRLIPTADDRLIFSEENLYRNEENPAQINMGHGHKETKLRHQADQTARMLVSSVENWGIYHFHDTSASAKMKLTNRIDDNRKFHTDASNLAPYLYYLKEACFDDYRNIVDAVRMAAPFFDTFSLSPYRLNLGRLKMNSAVLFF